MSDAAAAGSVSVRHRSLWGDVWRTYRNHTGALIGTGVFAFIVLAVVFGPMVWTIDPGQTNLRARKEQLLRAAYVTALRTDAEVVNYFARRLVQSQSKAPENTTAKGK